jgi:hypothetical protein
MLEKIDRNATAVTGHQSIPNEAKRVLNQSVQVFLQKCRVELQVVISEGRQMEQTYFDILERFGAPVDTDSEELFGAMSTFLKQFLAARKDLFPDWNPLEPSVLSQSKSTASKPSQGSPSPTPSAPATVDGVPRPQENGGKFPVPRQVQVQQESQAAIADSLKKAFKKDDVFKNANTLANLQSVKKDSVPRSKPEKFEGYFVIRERPSKKRWIKRYIELDATQLQWFKDKGGKYVNHVSLLGCEVTMDAKTVVGVKTSTGSWSILCPSPDVADKLKGIIADRSSGKLWNY